MATPDLILGSQNGTGPDTCGTVSLPLNPFVANRYHFGMLLGVADLDAEQAYHRGKAWLHAAWLHGPGAVWGLGVSVRAAAGEVEVHPGLALDRNGREMRVAERQCLDLGRWFVERRPDELEVAELEDGSVTFDVHVTLCADSCLDRPVPSISEPCSGADTDTAYSRSVERGLPDLAAGRAPVDQVAPYLRLRQLFGQLPAEDPTVLEAQAAIDAAADSDRPAEFLTWFRRLAALDTVDLQPDGGVGELFPAGGSAGGTVGGAEGCIPLADLAVHLRPDGDGWVVVDTGDTPTTVDNTVRPAHVRTRTIQELLTRAGAPDPGIRGDRSRESSTAVPRVLSASGSVSGSTVRLSFDRPMLASTVTPDAFSVTALRPAGWAGVPLTGAELDDDGTTVTLRLRSAPRAKRLRVLARGAGPTPLLSADGQPLSGTDADAGVYGSGADGAVILGADDPGRPDRSAGPDQPSAHSDTETE